MPNKSKKPTKKTKKNSSTNQMAIAGFVLTFIFFPLGLVFSIIALRQIQKTKQPGKGLAIAGATISGILTLLTLYLVFASVKEINQTKGNVSNQDYSESDLPPVGSVAYNVETGYIDSEKSTDITALQADLGIYHTKYGFYPSFADFNSPTWRSSAELPNIAANYGNTCDPLNKQKQKKDCDLVTTPSKTAYSYQTWQADGTTPCEAQAGESCPKYTLTAILIQARHNHDNPESAYLTRPSAEYPN